MNEYSGPPEGYEPSSGEVKSFRRERPEISFSRRKELLVFAVELAEQVRNKVKPHELCMLRNFTHGLLERE